MAQSPEESALAARVELLRRTILKPDRAAFDDLLADELSYGHSNGLVETKAQMMDVFVSGRSVFSVLEQPDQTITLSGDVAVVRHRFVGECVNNGEPGSPQIRVLQVWQKKADRWRLVARQGF